MKAINMVGIVKCFGSVRANDGIDFQVEKQEIHCLLGENGTGKSTLMNILFGLYHQDSGEIYINEKKAQIANPNDAYALGIGMVHQHFMLVNQFTVLENIVMGNEAGGFFTDEKACLLYTSRRHRRSWHENSFSEQQLRGTADVALHHHHRYHRNHQ